MINKQSFDLDYGTKVTTTTMEEIDVALSPEALLMDFAVAYEQELSRRNILRAKQLKLGADTLYYYFWGLLYLRVMNVHGNNVPWREMKLLFIPSWIEYNLTCVGRVIDRDRGLVIYPVLDSPEKFDIKEMLAISNDLGAFVNDGIVLHQGAFPTQIDGDFDVMSMAVINDYVFGMKVTPPIASYVAGFLGFKLQQEAAFKALYRVRYDDVAFLKNMLINDPKLR